MATRQSRREEYSSSNVVRTLTPNRPLSPGDKGVQLDNLLDDLQTTVTRTANHLNSSKARDVEYLSPANQTTVVNERSISPAQDGTKIYKTSHYEYSSSRTGGKGNLESKSFPSTQANVSQLDNLLEDLKQERDISFDIENNKSNVGIDSGLLEPGQRISKTTRTVNTTRSSGASKPTVKRELAFDSPSLVSSISHESRTQHRNHSPNTTYKRREESHVTRDAAYDTEPVLDTSPTSTTKRTYNYTKTSERSRHEVPYNTNIVEVETTDLPAELKDVPLSSDLLPQPGTKVTTTIKTFTYEIPNDTKIPTNQNFTFKKEFYNSTNNSTTSTSYPPERDVPPPQKLLPSHGPGSEETYIYKTESHNTTNRTDGYPAHPPPATNQTYLYKREVNETTNNVYGPPGSSYVTNPQSPQPTVNSTLIHERNETNTTRNYHHPPNDVPYPSNTSLPPAGQPGPKQTYFYKKETSNTTNTTYGPPGGDYSPHIERDVPLRSSPYHNEPTTKAYKYTSESTTTNVHNRLPDREPLLSRPFPTDAVEPTHVDGHPPKHLGQLLASFDNTNHDKIDDEPYVPRKEVNTALASNKSVAIADPKVPTKNIAGPPVYYPPGKELFAKSEAQAAWRAQGGYGKGSGKYEYEAESKSKSSSKSGAAVVPVCLPLCCAMPCTIM